MRRLRNAVLVATVFAVASFGLVSCSFQPQPEPRPSACQSELPGFVRAENARREGVPNEPFQPQIANDDVQIYVNAPSYACGDTLTAVVGSKEEWTLEIWRLGDYAGKRARKVWSSETQQRAAVITPERSNALVKSPLYGFVSATGGASTEVKISGEFTPGLYLARVHGAQEKIADAPFTIRGSAPSSAPVFVTSASTYQMYNAWGGSSAYRMDYIPAPYRSSVTTTKNLPQKYAATVSDVRPWTAFQTLNYGDWPIVSYLESQGIDVGFMTDADITSPDSINQAQTLVFGQHPEYVTSQTRVTLDAAVKAGTNIVVFGANEFYWKIEREFAGTEKSRIYVAKPGRVGLFDNDASLRGERLSGTGTACVKVYGALLTAKNPTSRIFAGLSAADVTRVPGLFVQEVDNSNASVSPKAQVLAESTVPLCAERAGRGTTAQMTLLTHASGAEVFTAGGFGFSCSLVAPTTCPPKYLADERSTAFARAVLGNVLERFASKP